MKKQVIILFSILLLVTMPNSFAASTDNLKLVSDGVLVCGGGPPSRHVIRNINDDLHLLINSIVITDGFGIVRYDSGSHGFGPLNTTLEPRQGVAFRIIDALELTGNPEEHYRDLRGPWQTTIVFSLVNGIGSLEGGLAPFVLSVHFVIDGRSEPWSFRDFPVAAFSTTCRYKELTEIQKEKIKD